MFTLISHEDDDVCESDEGVVGFVQLVVTRKNSSELLNIAEVTLDHISPLVQLFVIPPRLLAIALRRHHRTHFALFRLRPASLSLIRLVHQQRLVLAK